jgi:thiol-disulfide isomerase/thioredoxin
MTAMRLLVSIAMLLSACENDPAPKPEAPSAAKQGVEIIAAPPGNEEATALIQRESANAAQRGRKLVVYVGAEWCEPCKYFHEAAVAGRLDRDFPTLTLLEFDHDRDLARLERAGCRSPMIPLFSLPDAAGRCTERRISGSIKGPAAVGEITPRLSALLR